MAMEDANNTKEATSTGSSSFWTWATNALSKGSETMKEAKTVGENFTAFKEDVGDALSAWFGGSKDNASSTQKASSFNWLPFAIAGGIALMKFI